MKRSFLVGLAALGVVVAEDAHAAGPCLTQPLADLQPRSLSVTDGAAARLEHLLPIAQDLRGGALQDAAIRSAVREACAGSDASQWLKHSCSLPGEGDALQALRTALVLDAVGLAARAQDQVTSVEGRTQLGLAVAVLEALLLDPTPRGVALRLLAAGQQVAVCEASRVAPQALTLAPRVPPELQQLAVLIWSLQERLAEVKSDASRARQVADEALARLGAQALSDAQAALLPVLIEKLAALEQARSNLQATWLALLDVVQAANQVVPSGAPAPELASKIAGLQALGLAIAEDNGSAFKATTLALLEAQAPRSVSAARVAFELLAARDQRELDSMTSLFLRQLGPWAENVIFDVNIGAAHLASSQDFNLAGDLTLGYAGKAFGVVAHGFVSAYDLTTQNSLSQTERAGGSGDLFWVSSPGSARFELRLSGGGYLYNSDLSTPQLAFADEQNLMGRGSLAVGLRVEPSENLGFALWAGGGAQIDLFDGLTVQNNGTVTNASESASSAVLEGRMRFQVAIIPRWLAFRSRVDFSRFSFSRDAALLTVSGGGTVSAPGVVSDSTQMELFMRGFIDAEAARFAGFVPSVGGGLDYINQSSDSSDLSATVPVFHAGLRRVIY